MKVLILLLACMSLNAMDLHDAEKNKHLDHKTVRFDVRKADNGDFTAVLFDNDRTTTVKRYHHTGQFKYHCIATLISGEMRQVPAKKDDLHFLMLKIKDMHQQDRISLPAKDSP